MKKILLTMIAAAAVLSAAAQEIPEKRSLKLTVRSEKGKVVRDPDLVAFIQGDSKTETPDRSGNSFFKVSDADTLNVVVGRKIYQFPVAGLDSIHITLKNRRRLAEAGAGGSGGVMLDIGYGTVSADRKTTSVSYLDMKGAESYSDLKSYIMGRVPGVQFFNGKLVIRGLNSINSGIEALIVVDGTPFPSFESANSIISPITVESISVLKDGGAAIYGSRGANGVVLITTKKAGR